MNTLTVDIGNTSVKIDAWADDSHLSREIYNGLSAEAILKKASELDVAGIIFASVRESNYDFIKELKESFTGIVVDFNEDEIRNHYNLSNYKSSVGPDRVAACLGTIRYPKEKGYKLVFDLGTAITVDLCDERGVFMGGNISLGMKGRFKALHEFTRRLPLVEKSEYTGFFGNDTTSAISAGVKNGVEGEILFSINRANHLYGVKTVFFTGGDAEIIPMTLIPEDIIVTIAPELVGEGLDYHLRRNYLT